MKIHRAATYKGHYKYLAKKYYDMTKLKKVIQLIATDNKNELTRTYKDHALALKISD